VVEQHLSAIDYEYFSFVGFKTPADWLMTDFAAILYLSIQQVLQMWLGTTHFSFSITQTSPTAC
jgi:hypothetical protein